MLKLFLKIGFGQKKKNVSIRLLSCFVLGVSSAALLGHLIHVTHFYQWDDEPGMALNTAMVFISLAICNLIHN